VLKTTDLCDAYGEAVAVLSPLFQDYGGVHTWSGPISTLRVFEDNALVRRAFEEPGAGRVLVVDGGGSMRCALVGDQLAELARGNGWAGVLVYGCVRDAEELAAIAFGVKALNTHPRRSIKQGAGERDVPITFGGVTLSPGQWLYADPDGVVTSATPLELPAS